MPINPPAGGFATHRPDLRDAFYGFTMDGVSLAYPSVFPPLGVDTQAGEIECVTRKSMLSVADGSRAPSANYNRINVTLSAISYKCADTGLEHAIPAADGSSISYNREEGAVRHLWTKLAIADESVLAATIFDTGTFTGADLATTVGTAWSDPNADIIGDVLAASEVIRANTGVVPNTLVISAGNMVNMLRNTGIRAAFPGVVALTAQVIKDSAAALFGLSNIAVSSMVYDANGSGAVFAGTNILSDDYAFVCKTASAGDGIEVPCIGRHLFWTGDSDAEYTVENYWEEATRNMIYRARHNAQLKMADPYFGHLLNLTPAS